MSTHNTGSCTESLESRRLLSVDFDWGVGGGCSQTAQADAVATDDDGSAYVLGHFTGTIDLDPSKNQSLLTATGSRDLFVAKYSANRKLLWAHSAGGPNGEYYPTDISLDPNGLVALVGSFTGSVTLGGTSRGGEDAFIIQLDQDTGHTMVRTSFGGPYYDAIRTVDASLGYPLVGGVFTKTVHFPQARQPAVSKGGQDGFIFRYIYDADINGFITIGGSGYDAVNQLRRDRAANQWIVGGVIEGTAQLGQRATPDDSGVFPVVSLKSHGGRDAFYGRYDLGLRNLFAQRYGGKGDDAGYAVAAGLSGAYLAGTFNRPMHGLTSTGGRDLFVKRIGGNILQIGSTADDGVGGLAVDSTGRLIVTGMYGAPMTFNNIALPNLGDSDVFMAMYDNGFEPETIVGMGGPHRDTTTGLASASGGTHYLVGSFRRWFDLAPGPATALLHGNLDSEFYLDRLIDAT
jgi:hypothetical protein